MAKEEKDKQQEFEEILSKLNENEKKLYALFNRVEITRNESENNYAINLATFLYEPEKLKA